MTPVNSPDATYQDTESPSQQAVDSVGGSSTTSEASLASLRSLLESTPEFSDPNSGFAETFTDVVFGNVDLTDDFLSFLNEQEAESLYPAASDSQVQEQADDTPQTPSRQDAAGAEDRASTSEPQPSQDAAEGAALVELLATVPFSEIVCKSGTSAMKYLGSYSFSETVRLVKNSRHSRRYGGICLYIALE